VALRSVGRTGGRWDPDRIAQVIQNLVVNAFNYSPTDTAVEVAVDRAGERVIVAVTNDGPPIPPELAAAYFFGPGSGSRSSPKRPSWLGGRRLEGSGGGAGADAGGTAAGRACGSSSGEDVQQLKDPARLPKTTRAVVAKHDGPGAQDRCGGASGPRVVQQDHAPLAQALRALAKGDRMRDQIGPHDR